MKRFIVDCITLVRVPVIILLAFVVSPDKAELAWTLLLIGMVSHALDGIVAKQLNARIKSSGFWHEMDTAWLSLGLQLGAAIWLIRVVNGAWWSIAIVVAYLIITALIEKYYIEPMKKWGKPYKPIVLYGSGVIWMTLSILISAQDSSPPLLVDGILWPVVIAVGHYVLHPEVWSRWKREYEGKPPLYRSY